MATPNSQRIGIWIIAAVMAIGSVGAYFVVILANNNDSSKQQNLQQVYSDYLAAVERQASELSAKHYATFAPFAERVRSFDATTAQEKLVTEDLVVGDGEVITGTTPFAVYYIGWNERGVIFDQSIQDGALKAPLSIAYGLDKASLIEGWIEGLQGMRIGGVRELTVPSEKAYKDVGSGENIAPNAPLKFVVMAIPPFDEVPIPEALLSQ